MYIIELSLCLKCSHAGLHFAGFLSRLLLTGCVLNSTLPEYDASCQINNASKLFRAAAVSSQQVSRLKTFCENVKMITFGCQLWWWESRPPSPAVIETSLSDRRRELHLIQELQLYHHCSERVFKCQWRFLCEEYGHSWSYWAKRYLEVCLVFIVKIF